MTIESGNLTLNHYSYYGDNGSIYIYIYSLLVTYDGDIFHLLVPKSHEKKTMKSLNTKRPIPPKSGEVPNESPENIMMASSIWLVPSGYVKIAIENGHRNSEFSH